ncbi:DUF421 domain-containing protein [Halalkalibacter urbisdiaboli]|uniref:DUF421 domain-containing protein n=1 Tax=Halalkalibacter urbisdiaboli TaxID=1960589 RepID=UPI000B43B732|nr:DUF421 domain-containing protein [Halalkalibacter urbisdiaboli]
MAVMDFISILARIITLFPLLLVVTLFMGRRSIGEVPIFDFLVIVTLASIVGADIADPNVNNIYTAFTVMGIGIFQKFFSKLVIKHRTFGKLVTFGPTIVVKDGKLLVKNAKAIRYSIDNILQMLRQNNVFDINDVQLAIIEANGTLSVQKKPEKSSPTNEDLNVVKQSQSISYPIIIEGIIQEEILNDFGLTEETLRQRLENEGYIRLKDVFLCTINEKQELQFNFSYLKNPLKEIRH